jgi:hypothetical protein
MNDKTPSQDNVVRMQRPGSIGESVRVDAANAVTAPPDPEIIELLEAHLVLARAGKIRAVAIADVSEEVAPDGLPTQNIGSAFVSAARTGFVLHASVRRLLLRVEDKHIR